MTPKVYLVGAGPGDPELLTLKAWRLLQEADFVLYDRLIHPILLYFTKKEAQLCYVGKRCGHHSKKQEEINDLLVQATQHYEKVLRLKGGDPCIYGRLAEEVQALQAKKISYEIVPGITSALGASLYAGIIATERGVAEKLSFYTPAAQKYKLEDIDFVKASQDGFVALYMGLGQLPALLQQLSAQKAQHLSIALIEWGTLGRQRKIVTQVQFVEEQLDKTPLHSPCLLVLGPGVEAGKEDSWFECLPHFGESYAYITDNKKDLSWCLEQIRQGADVFPLFVGTAYEDRFANLYATVLPRYPQLRFKNEQVKAQYQHYFISKEEKQ